MLLYDNAEYVPEKVNVRPGWQGNRLGRAKKALLEIGYSENEISALEEEIKQ